MEDFVPKSFHVELKCVAGGDEIGEFEVKPRI